MYIVPLPNQYHLAPTSHCCIHIETSIVNLIAKTQPNLHINILNLLELEHKRLRQ
jgi:hypothetical protein